MVSQIFYQNQDKFPAIAQDYGEAKERVQKLTNQKPAKSEDCIFNCALETLPQYRRTVSLSDKVDKGDYIPALGAIGLTFINWKEDLRDLNSAVKQLYSKINPNYHYDPLYDRRKSQHAFSFTRGVVGEEYLYKKIDDGSKIAQKIYDLDKPLDETSFGDFVKKILKINEKSIKKINQIKDARGTCARAVEYESKIFGGEITARAMRRTTLIGVLFLSALEIPKIIKETSKGNSIKQTAKSSINVISTTAGIGYGGAIGAKYAGATGSLIGMGIGAILGGKISEKLQSVIS